MCMPNLVPPITTVAAALAYRERLQAIDPSIEYLVTLFLDESITPDVIREAKKAGVTGVKSYPKGTTTNSAGGVISYDPFFPTFAAMEEVSLLSLSAYVAARSLMSPGRHGPQHPRRGPL
jgi:dihydroorotase